jgi:hypothetical protein
MEKRNSLFALESPLKEKKVFDIDIKLPIINIWHDNLTCAPKSFLTKMSNSLEQFRLTINICFHKTLSTLKALALPSILISPLGLCTQAIQLSILISFMYTFHFNYLCKWL